jgi:hypothetical protein
MLAFVTPAGFEAFLEEVGEEAMDESSPPPFGQEEIARILASAPKYGIEMAPWASLALPSILSIPTSSFLLGLPL